MKATLISLCILFTTAFAYSDSDIVSARIESCRGCSLNRLPEVKAFIFNDAPLYERLEVKFITGAPPELILLGKGELELERLPLSNLNREQCIKLIESKGFEKSPVKENTDL